MMPEQTERRPLSRQPMQQQLYQRLQKEPEQQAAIKELERKKKLYAARQEEEHQEAGPPANPKAKENHDDA